MCNTVNLPPLIKMNEEIQSLIDKNEFKADFTPPQFDKNYGITQYFQHDTGLSLIHKLVFFPNLLREYLSDEKTSSEVNKTTSHGFSALYIACRNESIDSVKILLQHPQIDVNLKVDNTYILNKMCSLHCNDVVKELLKHPQIDVNSVNDSGFTPLIVACRFGNAEGVRELVKHPRINVNFQTNNGRTPLLVACQTSINCVKELLKHPDIDVNFRPKGRWAALEETAENRYFETVEVLLDHPKIDTEDIRIQSPLLTSLLNYRKKIKELTRLRELDLGSLLYQSGKQYI